MTNSNEITWEFAPTYGSDDDGFSDAFIEAFTGDVDKSLARETIQNSIDARRDFDNPVIVEFNRIECEINTVPGIEYINKVFEQCLEYYPADKKVKRFFENSLTIINSKKISILKVSDYNTVGLRGDDDDNNGEWYCLIKAQGASSKREDKLGSFGIGKGAPFAASAFRTVFYSTVNDKDENVFQGKARLVSHRMDSIVKRGIGSFGNANYSSIRDRVLIPSFFQRTERGTDIFILAYRGMEKEWENNLIKSVLENYWAAVYNKDLIVKVGAKIINYDTLENDLIKYFGIEDLQSPYNYFLSYTKPTKIFINELVHLGECKLYVLLQEKLPKKISLMRKSRMIIKYKGFHSPKPYTGVFICDDKKGNEILRDLEPPQHNDWEPKRTENGTKVLKVLEDWIRSCLREITSIEDVDTATMPGLEKWFQLPEDQDYEGKIENYFEGSYTGEESDKETKTEMDKNVIFDNPHISYRHKEPVVNKTKNVGPGKNKRKTSSKKKIKVTGENGEGENNGSIPTLDDVQCIKRSYVKNVANNLCEYILILQSAEDFLGNVKVSFSADDTVYPALLLNAKDFDTKTEYLISGSYINNVELKKDIRKKINLSVRTKQKVSLIIG